LILKRTTQCASAGYTTGNLNFISVGLDPTQGNKLSYSTLHFGQCYKTIGKHSLLFGANYEHFKSSNLFSGSNGVFIFNSLDEFYRAANGQLL
jgi:hypothetical protein